MFHVIVYQIHLSDIKVHYSTIPLDRHFKFVLKTSKTKKKIDIQKAGRLGQKKIKKYSSCVNRIDRQYINKFGKFELPIYTLS